MAEVGIEWRDTAMTGDSMRQAVQMKHKFERQQEVAAEMVDHFVNDYSFCEKYFQDARDYVQKLREQTDKQFYKFVNREIEKHFENKIKENVEMMMMKTEEANTLVKRRLFIWLKK